MIDNSGLRLTLFVYHPIWSKSVLKRGGHIRSETHNIGGRKSFLRGVMSQEGSEVLVRPDDDSHEANIDRLGEGGRRHFDVRLGLGRGLGHLRGEGCNIIGSVDGVWIYDTLETRTLMTNKKATPRGLTGGTGAPSTPWENSPAAAAPMIPKLRIVEKECELSTELDRRVV